MSSSRQYHLFLEEVAASYRTVIPTATLRNMDSVMFKTMDSDLKVINLLLQNIHSVYTLKNHILQAFEAREINSRLYKSFETILDIVATALVHTGPLTRASFADPREIKLLRWTLVFYGGYKSWNELATYISLLVKSAKSNIRCHKYYGTVYNVERIEELRRVLEYYRFMILEDAYFAAIGGPLSDGERDSLGRDMVMYRRSGYCTFTGSRAHLVNMMPRELLLQIEPILKALSNVRDAHESSVRAGQHGGSHSHHHGHGHSDPEPTRHVDRNFHGHENSDASINRDHRHTENNRHRHVRAAPETAYHMHSHPDPDTSSSHGYKHFGTENHRYGQVDPTRRHPYLDTPSHFHSRSDAMNSHDNNVDRVDLPLPRNTAELNKTMRSIIECMSHARHQDSMSDAAQKRHSQGSSTSSHHPAAHTVMYDHGGETHYASPAANGTTHTSSSYAVHGSAELALKGGSDEESDTVYTSRSGSSFGDENSEIYCHHASENQEGSSSTETLRHEGTGFHEPGTG